MSQKIWMKNLKLDLDKIYNYVFSLQNYVDHLFNKNEKYSAVHSSIIKQFVESLEAIVILLNSNFKTPSEMLTSKINNISGVFILLRKTIEANMMLNIVLNYGQELYDLYLMQADIDESHIAQMFEESNGYFRKLTKVSNNKYYWIAKALDKNVFSIDDLIDIANLSSDAKANIKAWIKECNYMSHPALYSNDKLLAPYNGEFIQEIYYIFEIIMQMIFVFYEMIQTIEEVPKFNSRYDIKKIERAIPEISIFKEDFFTFDRTSDNEMKPFEVVDYNQMPYNVRAEYSMMVLGVTAPFVENGMGGRKKTSIGKLIDVLAEDLRDLLIGYYHKNNFIFYSKIRQVLEGVAHIDQILKMDESEIEIFQCYTDIQRYKNARCIISLIEKFNPLGFDFKKLNIGTGEDKLTVEQYYQQNFKFYRDYFENKFNKKMKVETINRPNSWLYDGKKIPSNWQMIKTMLIENDFITKIDIKFYNGLYSLSSLFCHVNNFSLTNELIGLDKTYIEILKSVMIIVKRNYDKLMSYTPQDYQEIFKQNMIAINRLLYNLYNYDTVDVPNPN